MAVEDKVKSIIAEQLGVEGDEVKADSSFTDDLGADSLDIVELVMAFEEEFDITVPDEDAEKLTSVGEVNAYIEEKSSGGYRPLQFETTMRSFPGRIFFVPTRRMESRGAGCF